MRDLYFNRAGQPVDQATPEMWSEEARRVDLTEVGDYRISTVHLVVNHQFGDGPPLLFETMVFCGESMQDQFAARYSTEAQAQEGHDNIVGMIRVLDEAAPPDGEH